VYGHLPICQDPGGAKLERIFERGDGPVKPSRSPRATAPIVVPARQDQEVAVSVRAGGLEEWGDYGRTDHHEPKSD
jgi:hypothetical protein